MYGKSVLLCRVARSNVRYMQYKSNSTKKLLEFLADMPKVNTQRIAESQRQRQQISKKSEKYGPSSVYLQVLGSGARGVPNTLYMFTDQKRYLFNCGEQTQRLAHEHKVKLSRLDHVFITSKTWRNIGGLPGLSLTLQDVGVPSITLHGPEGLDELYSATKRFVIMKEMKVTMAKCSPNEDFEDNVMSVKYVVLGPNDESILGKDAKPAAKRPRISENIDKNYEEFMQDNTDYYRRTESGGEALAAKKYSKDRKSPVPKMTANDPMKKRTDKVLNDLQKMTHCTVSYICTLKKRLGTLDLAKCVERGVKPGPLLGQLKAGHDVVLPDGTLVLSKDVKTPDDPGPVFIVLDVPDISYLKDQDFSAHFANGENPLENIPALIVHYTPPEVFHDPAYQKFISLFGPTPRHLILNGQNSCLGSEAVHRTQHKLHLLDPDIFPLLRDVSVPAVWSAHPPLATTASPVRLKGMEELKNKIALAQFQSIINMEGSKQQKPLKDADKDIEIIAARTLTMFQLRPKRQLDRSVEPKLHIQDYIQESMDVDGFVGSLEQFRRLVDNLRYAKRVASQEYPKVVFLGTGSCVPSKTRNTSSIVVHVDETRSILLDCGEGTFGQLVRFYGPKKVNSFLRTLRAIYISHLHADHHIGLIGVLQARRQAFAEVSPMRAEPARLLAPGQLVSWLALYDRHFERLQPDYTLLPNQALLMDKDPNSPSTELTSAVLASLGVSSIATCFVPHCPNAFGVAFQIGPHKITYSGDTLPCESLIKLGQDSTLLIHEATMEDELADEARMKMHSTTTQAIEVGRRMRAQYTVLTHFSQRYARLPRLNENILNDNNNVGIAFDNMQITMSDLELLPHMYAPLQLMFAEHCVEMELKAAHRAQRNKRLRTQDLEIKGKKKCRTAPSRNKSNSDQRRQSKESVSIKSVSRQSSPTSRTLRNKTRSASKSPESRSSLDHRNSIPTPTPTPKCGDSGRSTPAMKQVPDEPDALAEHPLSGTETISIARTLSLSSSVNNDTASCDTHVINTHSKTLNTTVLTVEAAGLSRSQNAEINHITRNSTQIYAPSKKSDVTSSSETKGYGKPLVTPVTKRLTLRRDIQLAKTTVMQNMPSSKSPSPVRSRPPTPQKGDVNRNNVKTVSKAKTPTKPVASAKCRVANSDVSKNAPRNPVTVRGTSSSQNTHAQSRFGTAKINYIETAKPRWRDPGPPIAMSRNTPKSIHKDNVNKIDSNTRTNSRKSSSVSLSIESITYSDTGSPTRPCSPRKTISSCSSQGQDSEASKLLQNVEHRFNEPAAHQTRRTPLFDRNGKFPYHRVNSALHNSKYFKPQLEDIKSSFLLLNKKQQNWRNIENVLPPKKEIQSIAYARKRKYCEVSRAKATVEEHKPKPISEEERRQTLLEVKKSFKTKQFFQNSKYDKIEGLNWISWK